MGRGTATGACRHRRCRSPASLHRRVKQRALLHSTQVSHALQHLRLSVSGGSTSSSVEDATPSDSSGGGGAPSASAAACFTGAAAGAGCLGVAEADLLASEALPSAARRIQALAAALPAVEAELQRRCRLVAAASGYAADDFSGLSDHIRQLQTSASQASQVGVRVAIEDCISTCKQAQQGLLATAIWPFLLPPATSAGGGMASSGGAGAAGN